MYGTLAQRSAFDIVVKYARAAGLDGCHHHHRIRHSYATDLLRRGASLETIRQVLGHTSIITAIRYLHVADADLFDAIDRAFDQPDDGQAA